MKLIEKLAREWINTPRYAAVPAIYYCYEDSCDLLHVDFEKAQLVAFEAGFRKAREMAAALGDQKPICGHLWSPPIFQKDIMSLGEQEAE